MVGILVGILSLLGGIGAGQILSAPPLTRMRDQAANSMMPNRWASPGDAISFRRRKLIDDDTYYAYMLWEGFDEQEALRIYNASAQLLDVAGLLFLERRGRLEEGEYHERMGKLGYSETTADEIELTTRYYGSASDIVRFAVREVYTPEVVERFGLMEDLPPRYLEEASKIGIDEETAKSFWASHWILPSLGLGYEMLHRNAIDPEDLDLLMKTQDIMPFWRGPLKQISYAPYTRVDVRRMYQSGTLKREDVLRSYLDLGYDEFKAEKMTQFTVAWSEPEARKLTRTMIERAYSYGELTREEAIARLVIMGYDEANADLIISLLEMKEIQDIQDDIIQSIIALFKNGVITQDQAIAQLDMLDLKASYRTKIIAKSLTAKEGAQKLPTKADIVAWYKLELIDEDGFRDYFDRLGFRAEDIERYLNEIWLEVLDELERKSREANPKLLPRAVLTRLFKEGTIKLDEYKSKLEKLHFSDADIELLVLSAQAKMEAEE